LRIATLLAAGLLLQAGTAPPPARLPAECPRVSLTYFGGLGFEGRSGLVFALWDSGTIIRAARVDAPGRAHVIGVVPVSEVASLVEAVKSSRFWDGESLIGIDVDRYTLELRRPNDRVGRAETPEQRLSPSLEDIRRRAFGLALTGARRIAIPIEEPCKCPATVWRDE
jgi:hypothetical protein